MKHEESDKPAHCPDNGEGVAEPLLPTYSEDGVDLTLIRWMLSFTPAERLRIGQSYAESTYRLGIEVVSQSVGDRWKATAIEAFSPPPPKGFVPPPSVLLRPLDAAREIQAGEVFCSIE